MKKISIEEISIDEFIFKLTELFEAKLEQSKLPIIKNRSHYLTRIEVAKILKISLPSLSTYTKEGWLQSYKIGNRVLYKPEEIDQAIQKLSTYKHKRGL
jgi:Helix-turn-helix domain